MHPAKTHKAITDTLIAVLFGGLIFLPFLLALTEADRIYSETERRFLTGFPAASSDRVSLVDFARGFDAYYQDHFGLRELLIYRYHREINKRFRNAPAPEVVVGRDGWFFYSGERVLEDLRGGLRLEPGQLEQLSEKIRANGKWLEQQGIAYLFAVAPNKQSIYPDLLPDYIPREKKESRLDQVVAALNGDGESRVIDFRPALLASREKPKR
jgi:alginate O-acetyltransferase complex protein AlgJ